MKKKIFILVLCIFALAVGLTACNSKTYKQSAVTGQDTSAAIENNGGLVVKQGNHIYYVNAYNGVDANNTFGEQTKSCLMRAELDAEGKVIESSKIIMVPMNIYSSSTKSGIYIYKNWIYFATPNVEKTKSGEVNTTYLDFMRVSIDRTVTELLFTIDSRSADFRFTSDSIMVFKGNSCYTISLNAKKINNEKKNFKSVLARASGFTPIIADNAFGNYSFVLQALDADNVWRGYNTLYAINGSGSSIINVIDGSVFDNNSTIAVMDYVVEADGLTLFYTRTASISGANVVTLCSYKFADASFSFNKNFEKVLAQNYAGSSVKGISDAEGALVTYSAAPYLQQAKVGGEANTVIEKSVTVKFVYDGYVYYTNASSATTLFRYKLTAPTEGDDLRVEQIVSDFNHYTSWIGLDIIDGYTYYLDSKTMYIYRVKLGEEEKQSTELVGLMTPADKETYEAE